MADARPRMVMVSSPVRPSESAGFAAEELQGQDPHSDEVRPVDAFEGLGEDGADAEQLGGPWPPSHVRIQHRSPCPR